LANLDGRTREAKLLRRVKAELTAHVGGNPSATQRALIERVAMLTLRIHAMDEKCAGGDMTELDTRTYLAWSNTLARTVKLLGIKGEAAKPPSLHDIFAKGQAAA
jgi:hypothetical protein